MIELSRVESRYYDPYTWKGIECALSKDGQLFMFSYEDVVRELKKYPQRRSRPNVWFFNDSFDREIAERRDDRILANPQFAYGMEDREPVVIEGEAK